MDLRNNPSMEVQIRELVDRQMSRLNTAMPGVIESFDPETQRCSVTPSIKMKINVDGEQKDVPYPMITNVPLMYPHAGVAGFMMTMPVNPGDHVMLIFSQRAIDNWLEFNGVQAAEDGCTVPRHHHITDATAWLVGAPGDTPIVGWNQEGIELRNRDANVRIVLQDDSVAISCGNDTGVFVEAGHVNVTASYDTTIDIEDGFLAVNIADKTTLNIDNLGNVSLVAPGGVLIDTPTLHLTGDMQIDKTLTVDDTTHLKKAVTADETILATGDISSQAAVSDMAGTMQQIRDVHNAHKHSDPQGGTTSTPV